MGAGAVQVIPIAMVLDINALLLMVAYRVDKTCPGRLSCLFPEHLLQFLALVWRKFNSKIKNVMVTLNRRCHSYPEG